MKTLIQTKFHIRLNRTFQVALATLFILGLAACGGSKSESDSGAGSSSSGGAASSTSTSTTQSCPAGELKASDGSCVRECTSDEVRNSAGICVSAVASVSARISCNEGITLSGSPELIKMDFSTPFTGSLSVTEICENGGVEASVGHGNISLSGITHTEFTRNAKSPCDHYIVDVNTGSQSMRCTWEVH